MPMAWAFYSYISVWAFGDASESVDEVDSPRYFYCLFHSNCGLLKIKYNNKNTIIKLQ